MQKQPTRREFLKGGALAAGAASLPSASLDALARLGGPRTEHVVLVAFAGGVRSKEVLETPANVPNLMRIASAGPRGVSSGFQSTISRPAPVRATRLASARSGAGAWSS